MDRMIYLSMAGAKAAMQRQDVLSHNLANVTTNGFRAELQAFRAVPVRGDGASTRAFALETTIGYNDAPGPLTPTGRNLDVAMQGKAWLAVQANDGTEAYTRAGSLDVNAEGLLVMRNGMPVLGDGGPINIPRTAPSKSAATAPSAPRRPTSVRPPWAGSSWSRPRPHSSSPAATTGSSAPPMATCRPTRLRGSRTVRWRAATSARSRPWSP